MYSSKLFWSEKEQIVDKQVEQVPVIIRGNKTEYNAVIVKENELLPIEKVVEINPTTYGLVPQLDIIETAIDSKALTLNRNLSSHKKDKQFCNVFDFPQLGTIKDPQDGGLLEPKIVIWNAYDRTRSVQAMLVYMRALCTNMEIFGMQEVVSFKMRHSRFNTIKDSLKDFIDIVTNQEYNIEDIKLRIDRLNSRDGTFEIGNWLEKLPFNMMIPLINAIEMFSNVDLVNQGEHINYSSMLSKQIDERKVKNDGNYLWRKWDEYNVNASYNEEVRNHWGLYNLMIKVAQYHTAQNKRADMAQQIGRLFFKGE